MAQAGAESPICGAMNVQQVPFFLEGAAMRHKYALPVLLSGVLLAGGGVAWSAVPDSDGVIHSCYASQSTRIIDPAAGDVCRNVEKSLSWNQKPPAASTGVPGLEVIEERMRWGDQPDGFGGTSGGGNIRALCPPGKLALSSGYDWQPDPETIHPSGIGPTEFVQSVSPLLAEGRPVGYRLLGNAGSPGDMVLYVTCATPAP